MAKKSGYKVAALTNVNEINYHFFRKLGFYDEFDAVVTSYDVGVRKPETKIYRVLFQKLKMSPEEMVFTDNSRENLVKAKKLGMKTIFYTNFDKFMNAIVKLGVKVGY